MFKCQKCGKNKDEVLTFKEASVCYQCTKKEEKREIKPCLRCGRNFQSIFKFNRICHNCKNSTMTEYVSEG